MNPSDATSPSPHPTPPGEGITDSQMHQLLGAGMPSTGSARRPWQPPTVTELQQALPHYEVTAFIAQGGMGAVYQGMQKSLHRKVAIKVLPPEIDDHDLQFAMRFQQEAQAMAHLSHPNIVAVYDAGETAEGLLYFVMEFVEGTDVGQLIAREGHLEPHRAITIITTVCEALAFAHEEGIIHRDIKPSNVIIDKRGRVKVADFGLAKVVDMETTALTRSHVAMGTPDFMAPEAQVPGIKLDQRADLYAVGVMLYQMLTGRIPRGRFELPSRLVPQVDKGLDAIIDRAMQTDRDKRYSSALEIKTDMEVADRIIIEHGSSALPSGLTSQATNGPRDLYLIAAAVVIVLGLAAFFFSKPKEPPLEPTAAKPSNQAAVPAVTSPTSSRALNNHRYQFIPGIYPWAEAKAKAQSMGGHLATIITQEEWDLVREICARTKPTPPRQAWLGAFRQQTDGPGIWATGEGYSFQAWRDGEPRYSGAGWPTIYQMADGSYTWRVITKDNEPWQKEMDGFLVEWEDTSQAPPTAPLWRDALAEAPLKEVIAQASHSGQSWRFPNDKHWILAAPPMRSGALRMRVSTEMESFGVLMCLDGIKRYYWVGASCTSQRARLSLIRQGLPDKIEKSAPIEVGETLTMQEDLRLSPGQFYDFLVIRVDGHWWVMFDGQLIMDAAEPDSSPGQWGLQLYPSVRAPKVEKVEYINLDELSKEDALRLAGLDTPVRSTQLKPDPTWQNLLSNVDLIRHKIRGYWELKAGELVLKASPWALCELPVDYTGGNYDLRVRVTRGQGEHLAMFFPFRKDGTGGDVILDYFNTGFTDGLRRAGVENLKDKTFVDPGGIQAKRPEWLPRGKKCTVLLQVRDQGLRVLLNDEEILRWTGNWSQMRQQGGRDGELLNGLLGRSVFGVGAFGCDAIFHSVELREVPMAEGVKLPPEPLLDKASLSTPALLFGGHRYQFVPFVGTWIEARVKAEQMGAHLATITSREEDNWLKETFGCYAPTPNDNILLGGYLEGAQWKWITGEPFAHLGRLPGEPSNDDKATCLQYWRQDSELGWDNRDDKPKGGGVRGFIAEWDKP